MFLWKLNSCELQWLIRCIPSPFGHISNGVVFILSERFWEVTLIPVHCKLHTKYNRRCHIVCTGLMSLTDANTVLELEDFLCLGWKVPGYDSMRKYGVRLLVHIYSLYISHHSNFSCSCMMYYILQMCVKAICACNL